MSGPTPTEASQAAKAFSDLVAWQYREAGLSVELPVRAVTQDGDRQHYDRFDVDELVVPKTFDRQPGLVVCVSGGPDGAIALAWARDMLRHDPEDVAVVHVNYGAAHAGKARQTLAGLLPWYRRHATWVFGFNAKPPDDKSVVPAELPGGRKVYRNALLAAAGSLMAPTVWVLAGTSGGARGQASKSTRFFADVSIVLSRQHDRPVHVTGPFRHMTKAQQYGWFCQNYQDDAYRLFGRATDCDDPDQLACGNCRACFKQARAFQQTQDDRLQDLRTSRYPGIDQNDQYLAYCAGVA